MRPSPVQPILQISPPTHLRVLLMHPIVLLTLLPVHLILLLVLPTLLLVLPILLRAHLILPVVPHTPPAVLLTPLQMSMSK